MPKKVPASLPSRKPRPSNAKLPADRQSVPSPSQYYGYRRSIAEIIDEYHDGRAKTVRR